MKLSKCLWLLPIALAAVAMMATGQGSIVVPPRIAFQGTHPMPPGSGGHLVAQGTHPMPPGSGGHLVAQGTHPMPPGSGGHLSV